MDPFLETNAEILQDTRSRERVLFWLSFFDIPRRPFGTPLGDRGPPRRPQGTQGAPKGTKTAKTA